MPLKLQDNSDMKTFKPGKNNNNTTTVKLRI